MLGYGFVRRWIRRLRIMMIVVGGLVAGLVLLAFFYVQDGDFLKNQVLSQSPRYFPTSRLEIARARLRPFLGECVFEQVKLWQDVSRLPEVLTEASTKSTDAGITEASSAAKNSITTSKEPRSPRKTAEGSHAGTKLLPALRLPFVRVLFDPIRMLQGEVAVHQIILAQPTVRLAQCADGSWNVDSLFASPWPMKPSERTPVVRIVRGSIELVQGGYQGIGKEDSPEERPPVVLRDVDLTIEPMDDRKLVKFAGEAACDWADRIRIEGVADPATGRVELTGAMTGANPGPKVLAAVKPEWVEEWKKTGLDDLECDVLLESASLKFAAGMPKFQDYRIRIDLLRGRLQRADLPFPLTDLRGSVTVRNDQVVLERAEGFNGRTILRAAGKMGLRNWRTDPLDVTLHAVNLQIDQRLQKVTPQQWKDLWVEYLPRGELNLAIRAVRDRAGGEIGFGINVDCRDVAVCYEFFPYPLEHIWGQITWSGNEIRLGNPDKPVLEGGLKTLLGNRPAAISGIIRNPGPMAEVDLTLEAENLVIDETLLNSLPPETRRVVDDFQPTGEVKARAVVKRRPVPNPNGSRPLSRLDVTTEMELGERCSIRWVGMPYPVHNLRGKLKFDPDRWVFESITGTNGTARLSANGVVSRIGPRTIPQAPLPKRRPRPASGDSMGVIVPPVTANSNRSSKSAQLKSNISIRADRLPFDDQLKESLPPIWRTTWETINPIGSASVVAQIEIDPSKDLDSRQITIVPDQDTRLNLVVHRRDVSGNSAAKPLELSLDQVRGQFVSNNGAIMMQDVDFMFRNARVSLEQGQVDLQNDGKFNLWAKGLLARDLHLDAGFRQKMTPVMARFAQRFDDGRPITFRADLSLGWSGRPGEPTWCRWENGLVVLNGNSFDVGWPLRNLQGQLDNLTGRFDGLDLEMGGVVALDTLNVKGFPINRFSAPFRIEKGYVNMPSIQADVLGGQLYGDMNLQIANEPMYETNLKLIGLDLALYAQNVPGRQTVRGRVSGSMSMKGKGGDPRNLQGTGTAKITEGDLGEIPEFLRFVKAINLSPATKTAFDTAQVEFAVTNGITSFDTIKFQGDAFSLDGDGTMSSHGDLDIHLNVIYGRDRMKIPVLTDAIKEATGQFIQVRVNGKPSYPDFRLDVLPSTFEALRSIGTQERAPIRNPLSGEFKDVPEPRRWSFGQLFGRRP
jgi:hypothetical protein